MKDKIVSIGTAVASMFSQQQDELRNREQRTPLIAEARGLLTQEMVRLIADDRMPEDFVCDRASYVAMAQMLDRALDIVDRAAAAGLIQH